MTKFRFAIESDVKCILDNWLDSYITSHTAGLIRISRWSKVMRPELKAILARPNCKVLVAYETEADIGDDDIYGWIAYELGGFLEPNTMRRRGRGPKLVMCEDPLVHYVYVKGMFRKRRIGRSLFRKAGIDLQARFSYTCKTPVSSALTRAKGDDPPKVPLARFNPLPARFPCASERANGQKEDIKDHAAQNQDDPLSERR